MSYNYYMAMSPVEQKLYISDPEAHQVFRVIQMEQVTLALTNTDYRLPTDLTGLTMNRMTLTSRVK